MLLPYRLLNNQLVSGLQKSLPYWFNKDFYYQESILNGNINADTATYGAVNNRHKKHLRRAHESIIDSAKLEEFTPLIMPNSPRPLRSHLPDSANIKDPPSFFDLFLKDDDFNEIVTNTNKYAEDYTGKY